MIVLSFLFLPRSRNSLSGLSGRDDITFPFTVREMESRNSLSGLSGRDEIYAEELAEVFSAL